MRLGSLFAGIGGFDLAAEAVGWSTAWTVEIDRYCRRVLQVRFPHARHFGDIRKVDFTQVPPVDVLAGGFPCQPHSHAGKRRGVKDARYLWPEFARAIREVGPRYVVVENTAGVLTDGTAGRILGDLAALGYDAEWSVLSAADVGAPHLRERVWFIAYPDGERRGDGPHQSLALAERRRASGAGGHGEDRAVSDAESVAEWPRLRPGESAREWRRRLGDVRLPLPDAPRERRKGVGVAEPARVEGAPGRQSHRRGGAERRSAAPDPDRLGLEGLESPRTAARPADGPRRIGAPGWWTVEPDVGRVAHGVPARVDRLRALGNAVVPACVVAGPFAKIAQLEAERLP